MAGGDGDKIEPFSYRVTVTKVVDGDTLDVDIDLGFRMRLEKQRLRLLGVNTPELKGKTRAAGLRAKDFTEQWLSTHKDLVIRTRKQKPKQEEQDSFGRYLAQIWGTAQDGRQLCLNDALLCSRNAVPFMEGK